MKQEALNFQRIEKAISFLQDHFKDQPGLDELAARVCLSPFHFQKLFVDWIGLSPKKFLQYLTLDYLRTKIQETQNMLDAADLVGLSGQSRVHDLFVSIEGVTPQQFKMAGYGMQIFYGYHPTPYGMCFIALAERGICRLHFIDEERKHDELERFSRQWHSATLLHHPALTQVYVQQIFEGYPFQSFPMKLLLKGTNFQLKVWEALLNIPYGSVMTYEQVAQLIVMPTAVRAVATAIGQNPLPYLIPCHRIITKEGGMGNYHWGRVRKKLLLGSELARFKLSESKQDKLERDEALSTTFL